MRRLALLIVLMVWSGSGPGSGTGSALTARGPATSGSKENLTTPGVSLPRLYWTGGVSSMAAVRQAGINELVVPAGEVAEWQRAGFRVTGIGEDEIARRRQLTVPKLAGRGNVASATRRPWIDANGWLFTRHPGERFIYELPAGKAVLAAAEAYAYGADALLRIAPEDLPATAKALDFLRQLPVQSLPPVADFTVVDNDSPLIDEVLNLLTRRNLLYQVAPRPRQKHSINIRLGTTEYPDEAAADPSAFAQTIRRKLGDENRSLRIYGSEIIIARLTGNGSRARLHLLNYSGRLAEGLRVRVRGRYRAGELKAWEVEPAPLEAPLVEPGSPGIYEATIPRMGAYAVIDLR